MNVNPMALVYANAIHIIMIEVFIIEIKMKIIKLIMLNEYGNNGIGVGQSYMHYYDSCIYK